MTGIASKNKNILKIRVISINQLANIIKNIKIISLAPTEINFIIYCPGALNLKS